MPTREAGETTVATERSTGDESPLYPTYAYKPSLFGAPWEFRLAADALEWQAGSRQGRVDYRNICRLRLSYRPTSMQTHRFLAEIWPAVGGKLQVASSSWRSMVESERHDTAYSAFLRELHRRIVAVCPGAEFEAGSSPLLYWPGLALFLGLGLALAMLAFRALQVGQWAGAAMIAGFFALFLWQIGMFFRRNRPRRYTGANLPFDLLP